MMKNLETKVLEIRGDREYRVRVLVNNFTDNSFWEKIELFHHSGL